MNPFKSSFGMPAETALCEFLVEMYKTKEVFMHELITLMYFLLDMLYGTGVTDHSGAISCLKLIDVVNEFVIQFQDKYGSRLKGAIPFFDLFNVIHVIEILFKWLYRKRYSQSWVKINQSFLDYNK